MHTYTLQNWVGLC